MKSFLDWRLAMRLRALFLSLLLVTLSERCILTAQQSKPSAAPMTSDEERAALHASSDWQLIAPHLADPATGSAAMLEQDGDVLRARRFPEDALDYYGYAMARGGDVDNLLEKMGAVRLELQQAPLARAMFLRCVRAHKNDAQAWNNLGATDYVMGEYGSAITEYKRSVRLNKKSAVVHANLGMAYFANKQTELARKQLALALQLDPKIMESRDEGGITAHVLATEDYAGFCFEMAKLFAEEQHPDSMRLWLGKASERGYDVRAGIRENAAFRPWLKDPQIQMMLQNTARMRKVPAMSVAPLPSATPPSDVN
jgi:tetratricopeptide (TPR) repeat protein